MRILPLILVSLAVAVAAAEGDRPTPILLDCDRVERAADGTIRVAVDGDGSHDAWARIDQPDFTTGSIRFSFRCDATKPSPTHVGLALAVQDRQHFDAVYLNPHFSASKQKQGKGKAIKIVPVDNGKVLWQKFLSDPFMADAEIPEDRWVAVRYDIDAASVRVFLDQSQTPQATFTLSRARGGVALYAHSSSRPVEIRDLQLEVR